MNEYAMWAGYAVIFSGGLAFTGLLVGTYCTYAYRKLLKDLPSWMYLQHVVKVYERRKKIKAVARSMKEEKQ